MSSTKLPVYVSQDGRAPDEELWGGDLPKKGPPRQIRLGVSKGGGLIVPLQLGLPEHLWMH